MSKETNRRLGHTDEADGIDEYDNPLPDWWVGLFWFTIVWAIAYFSWYTFGHHSQVEHLQKEMAEADARYPAQAAAEAAAASAFAVTPEAVAAGEQVFKQNCVVCHGDHLQGVIGPSFLDSEWLHGGQASQIIHTITNGVPAKGMVPWGGILSPQQINEVASFVITKNSEATGRPIEDFLKQPEQAGVPGEAPGADTAADSAGRPNG